MIQRLDSPINFKGVYFYPDSGLFNEKQLSVANDIVSKFDAQVPKKKKQLTYEKYFEKKGINFIIAPNDRYLDTDSVILFSIKGLKAVKNDKERKIAFDEKNLIGMYDTQKQFDIKDTDTLLKKHKNNFFMDILAYASLIASIGLLSIIG